MARFERWTATSASTGESETFIFVAAFVKISKFIPFSVLFALYRPWLAGLRTLVWSARNA